MGTATKGIFGIMAVLVVLASSGCDSQADPAASPDPSGGRSQSGVTGATGISLKDIDQWSVTEAAVSEKLLLRNISPPGTKSGVVVASPSQSDPNYYFHWNRDGALSMDAVVLLYEQASDPQKKARYLQLMQDYVRFSRQTQMTDNPTGGQADYFRGYGEPKFNVDGSAFTGSWGRPQNDGPALRAITLLHLARVMDKEAPGAGTDFLRSIYMTDASQSLLKSDLEFVAHHWSETSFDLWEEIKGHNFYTEMVQRRALVEGAKAAQQLGDAAAAKFYGDQVPLIETEIARHWNGNQGYLLTTLDQDGGATHKASNLDASSVIAALHARGGDGFFGPSDERVLATAYQSEKIFNNMYGINGVTRDDQGGPLAPAIGRYAEDIYDGAGTSRGNPWVLLTAGYGELAYRVANEYEAAGQLKVTALNQRYLTSALNGAAELRAGESIRARDPRFAQVLSGLRAKGDAFLRRVKYHANSDGSLNEEMDRQTGMMRGARDLTWNYASIITATRARDDKR